MTSSVDETPSENATERSYAGLTEQELVTTLTSHAHQIAASVLSKTDTGNNLATDAQVSLYETKDTSIFLHLFGSSYLFFPRQ